MRGTYRLAALGLAAVLGGCNGGVLDDGDSADVILLVKTATVAPITTQADGTGTCIFTVPLSTMQLMNKAKNADGASPYQDIVLLDVSVGYAWDDPAITVPALDTLPLIGTVEYAKENSVQFTPIRLGNLGAVHEGHSANLRLIIRGRTVEGAEVVSPPFESQGSVLSVNSCVTPVP